MRASLQLRRNCNKISSALMGYRSQYHFFNSLFGHDAQTHDICPLGLGGNSSSGPKPVYETSSSFTDTAILGFTKQGKRNSVGPVITRYRRPPANTLSAPTF